VRPRRSIVHVVGSHHFVLDSKVIQSHNIVDTFALERVQVFNCEYVVLVPLQLQTRSIIHHPFYMRFVEQVVYLFFINLKITAIDRELLFAKIRLLFYHFEKKSDRSRNNSFSFI